MSYMCVPVVILKFKDIFKKSIRLYIIKSDVKDFRNISGIRIEKR